MDYELFFKYKIILIYFFYYFIVMLLSNICLKL